MELNTEQQIVLDHFREFVNNDNNNVFILTGSAGTGKSTLLTAMFQGVNNRAIAMGPTGRSVKVLHDMGIEYAQTIHSSIYEHPDISKGSQESDEVSDSYTTTFSLGSLQPGINFIFVDEASMISDNETNDEFLKFGTGRVLADLISFAGNDAKIVFVGDNYQLPPVGDSASHALDIDYLQRNFALNAESYELMQIQRQASESGILSNATKLRDFIDTSEAQRSFLEFDYHNNDVLEIDSSSINDFDAQTLQNGVVIAAENEQVLNYNRIIREKIFGPKLKENHGRIMPGEKIIFSKNIYRSHLYHQDILNGDTAMVIDVSNESIVHPVEYQGATWRLRFRKISFKTDSDGQVETGYIYENFLDEKKSAITTQENQAFYTDMVNRVKNGSKNYADYQKALEDYNVNAYAYHELVNNWQAHVNDQYPTRKALEAVAREKFKFGKEYKPTLEQYGVNHLIKDGRENDPFFNAIVAKFGYAITGHKSQGGEWDTAIVDYSTKNNRSNDGLRWSYTATTRARHKLYVINPPKFARFDNMSFKSIDSFSKLKSFNDQNYQPSNALTQDLYQLVEPIIKQSSYMISHVEEPTTGKYYVKYYLTSDDSSARLQFYFDKRGLFTSCMPYSTLGTTDAHLTQIINNIQEATNN